MYNVYNINIHLFKIKHDLAYTVHVLKYTRETYWQIAKGIKKEYVHMFIWTLNILYPLHIKTLRHGWCTTHAYMYTHTPPSPQFSML